MNLINSKSKEVLARRRYGVGADAFVRVYDARMYFTSTAVDMCEIKVGEYMHFLNEGNEWRFYVNDDKDGFLISEGQDGRKGDHKAKNVCNVGLIRLFREATGFSHDASFYIEKTFAFQDKCSVFKINTKTPVI